MYYFFRVKWYSSDGEECSEDFDSKLEAMAFMEYNDFGRKAHPKLETIEAEKSFDENGTLHYSERVF